MGLYHGTNEMEFLRMVPSIDCNAKYKIGLKQWNVVSFLLFPFLSFRPFFFCCINNATQRLENANNALYQWALPQLSCFETESCVLPRFFSNLLSIQGQPLTPDLLIPASLVAGIQSCTAMPGFMQWWGTEPWAYVPPEWVIFQALIRYFRWPRENMKATEGEKLSLVLPSCEPWMLQLWLTKQAGIPVS